MTTTNNSDAPTSLTADQQHEETLSHAMVDAFDRRDGCAEAVDEALAELALASASESSDLPPLTRAALERWRKARDAFKRADTAAIAAHEAYDAFTQTPGGLRAAQAALNDALNA